MSKTIRKTSVGFSQTSGIIKRRVTREHTSKDEGKVFIDDYGKTYVYTKSGLIY